MFHGGRNFTRTVVSFVPHWCQVGEISQLEDLLTRLLLGKIDATFCVYLVLPVVKFESNLRQVFFTRSGVGCQMNINLENVLLWVLTFYVTRWLPEIHFIVAWFNIFLLNISERVPLYAARPCWCLKFNILTQSMAVAVWLLSGLCCRVKEA